MCLWKSRWLTCCVSAMISVFIALIQGTAPGAEAGASAPAAGSDGSSTLQVVDRNTAAEASEGSPAASSEPAVEAARSAEQASDQPVGSADSIPGQPAESADAASAKSSERPDPATNQQAAAAASGEPDAEPMKPIPDPQSSGPVKTETAAFDGITPGVSTLDNVQDNWGPPKEIANRNGQLVHLYAVEPFDHVEVSFVKDQVSAVVIRLERPFPADLVAEKLQLAGVRPVLVSDELGEVLGQAFPERGVVFAFEPSERPGTASMKVVQIILEPVTAEAFVLRAETHIDDQPELSMYDLEEAIKLDASHARAHWLRSRLLALRGDLKTALEAASEAVRLEPGDAEYRLTRAEILGQEGRFAEAIEDAEKGLAASTERPHIQARALCLLGDLVASQSSPDYRRALEHHVEAIKAADALTVSRHPAIRIAAKEVLVDAHLGAAHDIAWGAWDQKEKAVPRWLDQAEAAAKDLTANEGGPAGLEFRVATRALAALVGMRGKLDPAPWADEVLRVGQELMASTSDSTAKDHIRWDLGMALYDCVQIYQMRRDHEQALSYGKRAVGYLEPGVEAGRGSLADTYLLGRLYFRLGAIHAVGKKDHAAAVYWFEKAVPVFENSVDHLAHAEFGRLGETYVSMGVSFWESGEQDQAVRLSQRGVELMEQAVKAGALKQSALEVPYNNLATMARHMGKTEEADQYLQEARKNKNAAPLR